MTERIPSDVFQSDALEANLLRTADAVEIPARFRPLEQATSHQAARRAVKEALDEYFHRYRNLRVAIDLLYEVACRRWAPIERSPDRAHLARLLLELIWPLLGDATLAPSDRSQIVRLIAGWGRGAAASPHAADYAAIVEDAARRLADDLPRVPASYIERDNEILGWLRACRREGAPPAALTELVRRLLRSGYALIGERLDVARWALESRELEYPGGVVEAFSQLTAERMTELAERAGGDAAALAELPAPGALLDDLVAALRTVGLPGDRIACALYLLRDDSLGHRQQEVLAELGRAAEELLAPDEHGVRDDDPALYLLDRLRQFFASRTELPPRVRFDTYRIVGEQLGARRDVHAANRLIDDLIDQPFEYPDIPTEGGATPEWETVVNPHHLQNVRCWLRIVESNPLLFERLAAALHVQLKLGGVFVADTDLFQRDISRLLAADIRHCYFVVKQLLRSVPVYFNEIGAEGELRHVSTQVDELSQREDALVHFLRKQIHASSSSRLVDFCRALLGYWATGGANRLMGYLPAPLLARIRNDDAHLAGPRRRLVDLADGADPDAHVDALIELEPDVLRRTVLGDRPDDRERQRLWLMLRVQQLLVEKYSTDRVDYAELAAALARIDPWLRQKFTEAHGTWSRLALDDPRRVRARSSLLGTTLSLLEAIKAAVTDRRPTEASEEIAYKRHLAAGIPSMYGRYREPRFDALRVSLRLEQLLQRLLEEITDDLANAPYINRDLLKRMGNDLRRYERALALDGLISQSLASNLGLLEVSFTRATFGFQQYQNVFQFLRGSIDDLTRDALRGYDTVIRRILETDPRPARRRGLAPDAIAEVVLREVIVGAIGLQQIDNLVGEAVQRIGRLISGLGGESLSRMMNYAPDDLVSWIHIPNKRTDDQLTLGGKALGIKQLANFGLNVPAGFILTTQLFGVLPALTHRPLYRDTIQRIWAGMRELERRTQRELGNPSKLLTLSIRSGAAISMPGLMSTFINVGLNETLAAQIARDPDSAWLAWDSYRRLIQNWAMSDGVSRDAFDTLMRDGKRRAGVAHKHQLPAELMRDIALEYRTLARDHGSRIISDPFRQVVACVRKVLRSWDAHQAQLYRDYMGLAPAWGTAVIVQRMVYGNRSPAAGSGVIFTCDPKQPPTRLVQLFGDYTIRSQGEDLVGGLVFPSPISEAQRQGSPTYAGHANSLERDFPEIYRELLRSSRRLVDVREAGAPQEIEFTFESPAPQDLFFLQKRPMVLERRAGPSVPLDRGEPLAIGMGVAGAAYTGRVAFDSAQIDRLLKEDPEGPILLLRPDTVPEDIGMILRVDGILTARGGSTSHAAVTAKRLGKTAVVDCRTLDVDDASAVARINGQSLAPGDLLTIDGRTGRIWLG